MSVRFRPRRKTTRRARLSLPQSVADPPLRADLWDQLMGRLASQYERPSGLQPASGFASSPPWSGSVERRLAERIEGLRAWRRPLRERGGFPADHDDSVPGPSRQEQLEQALANLRERRFHEALGVLRQAAWHHAQASSTSADACWTRPPANAQLERGAWAVLAAEGREGRAVPQPPGLGDRPETVLERLVLGVGGAERSDLWGARLAWLSGDCERAWQLLAPTGSSTAKTACERTGQWDPDRLRQAVQWWLEAGRPGRALALLEGAGEALHAAPDLSQWMALCLAILGREREATEWSRGLSAATQTADSFVWDSPRARAWRQHCDWAGVWWPPTSRSGAVPSARYERTSEGGAFDRSHVGPPSAPWFADLAALRRRWGVACVAVLAWNPAGEFECLGSACAAGVRGRWESWSQALQADGPHGGGDQRRVLREARGRRWHAEGDRRLKCGALDAVSVAIHPVCDARGEPVAVLHVECEHHLLPTEDELEQAARCWSMVWEAHERQGSRGSTLSGVAEWGTVASESCLASEEEDRWRRRWVHAAVERLPFKLGRRRWAWLEPASDPGEPSWTAVAWAGSKAIGEAPLATDNRALERAARWSAPVGWRADREHAGLWSDSRCGCVWPIFDGARVAALLALESERIDDLDVELEQRVRESLEFLGAGWSFQCFTRALRLTGRMELDPWYLFDVDPPAGASELFDSRAVAQRMGEWSSLANDPRPILWVGEPGVGARAVAAWLDWRADPTRLTTQTQPARSWISDWLEPSRGWGTNQDAAVRDLARQVQRGSGPVLGRARLRLNCWREARDAEPHPDAAAAVEAAARLWPGPCLAMRALRERRAQLPGLAQTLWRRSFEKRRFADWVTREERDRDARPPALLGASTLAGLWRQSWPTQAAGLAAFLEACRGSIGELSCEPGEACELPGEVLRRELRRLGWQWKDKVPARHPEPSWLMAAVQSTRLANGRVNLRSASALLGWDRQTFARRWREGPGRVSE